MTTLSPHQEAALRAIVESIKEERNPLTYLAGYAGTGKSTLLPFILEALGYQPDRVWFCAPTGKAAKVMRRKLKDQQYPNSSATTIHSAIYRAKPVPITALESDINNRVESLARDVYGIKSRHGLDDPNSVSYVPVDMSKFPEIERQQKIINRLKEELSAAYREDKINFQFNDDSPIAQSELIVVDEASMVGRTMSNDLLSFGVPVLAMGDPGQLPPIEDLPGLTAGDPNFFLSEIHRQAQDNPIIHLSMLARERKDIPFGKYGDAVEVLKRKSFTQSYTDIDLDARPQFICGMNKTRWATNQHLREDFGFVQFAGDRVGPQQGEPLIVKKNNKEYPNLVNGTECTALSSADLERGKAEFIMSFEDDDGLEYRDKAIYQGLFEEHFSKESGRVSAHEGTAYRAKKRTLNMDWAYAFTCHSAQGSQWDDVVLQDESGVFRQDASRWLYTGITRAAKTLKILKY